MEKQINNSTVVANDPFAFLDKYIRPLDDSANPELLSAIKGLLDAYEIADLEIAIDTFGEALLDYFNDFDIIWKGVPNGMATDEWDIELLNIVIDYKNNSIDLEETVNRFRNILSDSKYYEIR